MAETRVKVYRVDDPGQVQAQAADQADAAAHGWHVVGRDFAPDGSLRLTYEHAPAAADVRPALTAQDYEHAVGEALRKDRARVEREKAINAFVSLVVLAIVAWWLFGQPTLEDMQTKSIGELLQGWRF